MVNKLVKYSYQSLGFFLIGADELVALAVNVDDFNIGILLEVLAELRDVHVHGASVEVVVVDPNFLKSVVALKNFVGVSSEQTEEFAFLGGELARFSITREGLLLGVEGVGTNLVDGFLTVLLALYATQDGLNAEGQFLHGERLSQIVVGAKLEAFKDILLQGLGGKEHDGHFCVAHAHLFGQRETIFLGHHHVENTEVKLAVHKLAVAFFTVGAEGGIVAFGLEIFAKQHAEVFVVFAKENSHFVVHNVVSF